MCTSALKELFIHQLNRVHCAKSFLNKHLPELSEAASFRNMKLAVLEAHEDVRLQLRRLKEIYEICEASPSDEGCEAMKMVIEESLNVADAQGKNEIIRDMDIILCMRLVETFEFTSLNMLKLINQFLEDSRVSQLLEECRSESIDNDKLFTLVSEEYLSQHAAGR